MALELYQKNEIPTSDKFNQMVNQVNDSAADISALSDKVKDVDKTTINGIDITSGYSFNFGTSISGATGVKAALTALVEILQKSVYTEDQTAAIESFKAYVDAITESSESSESSGDSEDSNKLTISTKVTPTEGGTAAGGSCESGESVTIIATPNTNYMFKEWDNSDGDQVSTLAEFTITNVTENATYTAVFVNTKNAIEFADANVKAKLVADTTYINTDSDDEISYAEAYGCTRLSTNLFCRNADITSFDELENFTGLTAIADYSFLNCTSLTSIKLPENITSIGNGAFQGCSVLASINDLPDKITTLVANAFRDCTVLTNIKLPSSLTTIGESAFNGCTALTIEEIPASVTSIANYAFYKIANTKIKCLAATPPTLAATAAFTNIKFNTMGIYVPDESYDTYIAADVWSDISSSIHKLSEY